MIFRAHTCVGRLDCACLFATTNIAPQRSQQLLAQLDPVANTQLRVSSAADGIADWWHVVFFHCQLGHLIGKIRCKSRVTDLGRFSPANRPPWTSFFSTASAGSRSFSLSTKREAAHKGGPRLLLVTGHRRPMYNRPVLYGCKLHSLSLLHFASV